MLQLICSIKRKHKISSRSRSEELDSLSLEELISRRIWHEVLPRLFPEHSSDQSNSTYANFESGKEGENILHTVCRFHPTPEIVDAILMRCPRASTEANSHGQFPIHIAAGWGAHPTVIQMLVKHSAKPLKQVDVHNRSPLILACKYYAQSYRYTDDMPVLLGRDALSQAIQILTKECPTVANFEDDKGISALEYAIESRAKLGSIQHIQRASYHVWKKEEAMESIKREVVNRKISMSTVSTVQSYQDRSI